MDRSKESWCADCALRGRKSKMRLFYLNLVETVELCSNVKCVTDFRMGPNVYGPMGKIDIDVQTSTTNEIFDFEGFDFDDENCLGGGDVNELEKLQNELFAELNGCENFDKTTSNDDVIDEMMLNSGTTDKTKLSACKINENFDKTIPNHCIINKTTSNHCIIDKPTLKSSMTDKTRFNSCLIADKTKLNSRVINKTTLTNCEVDKIKLNGSVINEKICPKSASSIASSIQSSIATNCSLNSYKSKSKTTSSFPLWHLQKYNSVDALLHFLVHNRTIRNSILENGGAAATAPFMRRVVEQYDNCAKFLNTTEKVEFRNILKNLRQETIVVLKGRSTLFPNQEEPLNDGSKLWSNLTSLLALSPNIAQLVDFEGNWELCCSKCGLIMREKKLKNLPLSFTNLPASFSVPDLMFTSDNNCSFCFATDQKKLLKCPFLPPVLIMRFENGLLTNKDIAKYDFVHAGENYHISAVIQHNVLSKRFITSIRDWKKEEWLRCDNSQAVSSAVYKPMKLPIEKQEIYIMIWEKDEIVATKTPSRPRSIILSSNVKNRGYTTKAVPLPMKQFVPSDLASLKPNPYSVRVTRTQDNNILTDSESQSHVPSVITTTPFLTKKTGSNSSLSSKSNGSDGDCAVVNTRKRKLQVMAASMQVNSSHLPLTRLNNSGYNPKPIGPAIGHTKHKQQRKKSPIAPWKNLSNKKRSVDKQNDDIFCDIVPTRRKSVDPLDELLNFTDIFLTGEKK